MTYQHRPHRNATSARILLYAFFAISIFAAIGSETFLYAQGGYAREIGWGENVPLTAPQDSNWSLPRLATDRQGRVHLFWVSSLDGDVDPFGGNPPAVIMYRRLDGDTWTEPNDVLATSPLGPLIIGSIAIDDRDTLNVLWFDQGSSRRLFLSQAHTSLAEKAPNWTTQVIEIPAVSMRFPDIAVEPGGKIHVVYPLDDYSIIYVASNDYGKSWSAPVTVASGDDRSREVPTYPRIAVDGDGIIHLAWTVSFRSLDWLGGAVIYARSVDGGTTWTIKEVQRTTEGEATTGWIGVAVRADAEVHLAWNRGVGSQLGRFHAWSADNGETWSEPAPFLPDFVSGQTSWPLMVVDSAETLHLITVAGSGSTGRSGGVQYAYWSDGGWSPMYTFPEDSNDLDVSLAISLGNKLHLVHPSRRSVADPGELLYSTLVTGAESNQARQIPEPRIEIASVSLLPTPTDIQASRTHSSPKSTLSFDGNPSDASSVDPNWAVALPGAVALLGVGIVVAWQLGRARRWR